MATSGSRTWAAPTTGSKALSGKMPIFPPMIRRERMKLVVVATVAVWTLIVILAFVRRNP